jgi:hypothetical protein
MTADFFTQMRLAMTLQRVVVNQMILDSPNGNQSLPDRRPQFILGEKGLPRMPIEPDPGLLEAARPLGLVADFLVIPSNGPHLLQAEIERAAEAAVQLALS